MSANRFSLTRRLMLSAALSLPALGMIAPNALAPAAFAQDGRALVIARDMDFNSLDPHRAWCDTCQIYNSSVYETLLTLDKDNKLVPLLAQSYSVSDDLKVLTLKLDPAAKFADGSPVEASDVKWSFERLKNLKANSSFLTDPIASIETPDAQSVILTLTAPNSEFPQILASSYMAIVNAEVAEANGALADASAADKDGAETWFLSHSAGSGPFTLESYEPNAELRLTRNDSYWRTPAHVPGAIFRQVQDAVSQAQMLQSGAVDIAMQIDPETAKSLEGSPAVVEHADSFNFVYVVLSPGAASAKGQLTSEVRQALSLAIDREGLIDVTLGGSGRPISAPIPLGFPGGDGHAPAEYNPERAKELLAAAGFAGGMELQSAYPDMNVYGVDLSLMMQKVQQDLGKVGVKVSLSPMPFSNWREVVNTEGTPVTGLFYAPDFFGTSQYVDYFGLMPGSVWAKRAGGEREPTLYNDKIGAVRDAALAAKTPEEAAKKWFEAGEMMIADHVVLPMVSPDLILAHGPDIKGVRFSACCNLPLAEISN